jgi:hypothetical protein
VGSLCSLVAVKVDFDGDEFDRGWVRPGMSSTGDEFDDT